jgi:hypothetical protein
MTRATLDPLTLPGGVALAVRLMDEESVLACAAYVDLNPIRAAMAETLEASDHTSVQRRIEAQRAEAIGSDEEPGRLSARGGGPTADVGSSKASILPDRFLSPLELDERRGELGPCGTWSGSGFPAVAGLDGPANAVRRRRMHRRSWSG